MTPTLTATTRTSTWQPALVLFIALAVASFGAILTRLAQQAGIPSPLIATGRMALSAIALTPLILNRYHLELRRLSRRDLLFALLAGTLLAAHFMSIVFALENTSVLIFTVIINTSPLWTALLELTFLSSRLNRLMWLGLLVTIAGGMFIALMNGQSQTDATVQQLPGIGLSLLASISGAAYITIGRSVRAKVSLFPYIWIVFGCGALIGLIVVLAAGIPITGHPAEGYLWVTVLALSTQLIGHSGFNYAVAYFSATFLSITAQSLTITASLAAYFVLAEVPDKTDVMGGAIIIAGVLLAIVGRSQRRKSPP